MSDRDDIELTVTGEAIEEMTRSVAETLLETSLEALPSHAPLTAGERGMFAWVSISGAWAGSVMIGCSEGLARHAAGTMFDVPPEDTTASDVADAVGELANVLGGNLKGLVPGPCALSLPSVSGDGAPDLSGGSRSRELWFRCHGEPLVILVVEGGTSAAA